MIPRLKGIIAHGHDTKLPGEDGEGMTASWGTRPSSMVKPFEEDSEDTSTHGWGNKPNPGKDLVPTHGWGNRPNPKEESHVRQRGRQSGLGKVYTYLAEDEDQTRGCGDMGDEYFDGRRGAAKGGQTDGYVHSVSS